MYNAPRPQGRVIHISYSNSRPHKFVLQTPSPMMEFWFQLSSCPLTVLIWQFWENPSRVLFETSLIFYIPSKTWDTRKPFCSTLTHYYERLLTFHSHVHIFDDLFPPLGALNYPPRKPIAPTHHTSVLGHIFVLLTGPTFLITKNCVQYVHF